MTAPAGLPPAAVFGRRVRDLRRERDWTMRDLAVLAGLNAATVCRVEQGTDTTLGTAARIAAALGTSLAVMLADPGSCGHCHGAPGRGFTCQACGTAGPKLAGDNDPGADLAPATETPGRTPGQP